MGKLYGSNISDQQDYKVALKLAYFVLISRNKK